MQVTTTQVEFGVSDQPAVHVFGLLLAVLLHTCITFSIVLLSVQSNIQGMFCPAGFAGFVHTGSECLHSLETVERTSERTGALWLFSSTAPHV